MYKKILVPLDGSKVAETILPHVRSIADGCDAQEVILLRVIEDPPIWVIEAGTFEEAHEAQKKATKEYLSKIQSRLNLDGAKVTSEVLIGKAPETIIDYANKNKVDLIIMITNVSSEISRLMIGSVADRVMRYSMLPVLMVRPKETT